jgi:cephalosporin-C deacetylase-like acetyl esterase
MAMWNELNTGWRMLIAAIFGVCCVVQAEEIFVLPDPDHSAPVPWNLTKLYQMPETFPAPQFEAEAGNGITPLFFKGEEYQGRETRVFAWVGIPTNGVGPFPAMVLVHGAGGTAYKDWVQLWMDRGYAAIAVDTASHIPVRPEGQTRGWQLHVDCGPRGWGGFDQVDNPVKDQWLYHAVAAVIRAHSLLRSYPQVATNRIGLTGISWGGHLTCVAAGVDDRFRFAAPVYGCGFLGEDSSWLSLYLRPMGREKAMRWLMLWDPSRYVNRVKMPMLFVNGTNDKHYRPISWQKTYWEVPTEVTLACRVRMPHSDFAGRAPEVFAYADALFKNGTPLPKITAQGRNGRKAWITYESTEPIRKAEINFTTDTGEWPQRYWNMVDVPVDATGCRVEAVVPAGATAYYINLFDARELVSSSELEEVSP